MRVKKSKTAGKEVTIEYDVKLGYVGDVPKAGDYGSNRIRIGPGMTPHGVSLVVLHEHLHHFWERAALSKYVPERYEEIVIDALAPWILLFLQENPKIVEMFTESD